MAQKAVEIGVGVLNGKKPSNPMMLLPSTLITRDNVGNYKGWSARAEPPTHPTTVHCHVPGAAKSLFDVFIGSEDDPGFPPSRRPSAGILTWQSASPGSQSRSPSSAGYRPTCWASGWPGRWNAKE